MHLMLNWRKGNLFQCWKKMVMFSLLIFLLTIFIFWVMENAIILHWDPNYEVLAFTLDKYYHTVSVLFFSLQNLPISFNIMLMLLSECIKHLLHGLEWICGVGTAQELDRANCWDVTGKNTQGDKSTEDDEAGDATADPQTDNMRIRISPGIQYLGVDCSLSYFDNTRTK